MLRRTCQRSLAAAVLLDVQDLAISGVEPGHTVVERVASREHHHARRQAPTPQFTTDGEAIPLRQHHVEDHRVVRIDSGLIDGRVSIGCHVHRVRMLAETTSDDVREQLIVFDEKYSQRDLEACDELVVPDPKPIASRQSRPGALASASVGRHSSPP